MAVIRASRLERRRSAPCSKPPISSACVRPACPKNNRASLSKPSRVPRFARNDPAAYGHCEEPPGPRFARPEDKLRDEAISICGSMRRRVGPISISIARQPEWRLRQALALAACGVEIAGIEPALEGLFERRPFAVEDREPAGVAVAALVDSGLAEEALVAKAEAQCCGARWRVERVAFPLVTPVAQFVEDTAHHQVHRLGGGWCALQERRKIDAADFDDAGRGIDAHIAGDADGASALLLHDAMN